jgi:hypothetical protein
MRIALGKETQQRDPRAIGRRMPACAGAFWLVVIYRLRAIELKKGNLL